MYVDEEDYDMVPYGEEEYYRNEREAEQQRYNRRLYGETIGGVLQAVTEYAKTLEREKTNRTNVERKRKTAITVIRTERHTMIEYLKQRFGERGALYDQYFKLIETALQINNEEILRIALENIQNIYQDNPCAGIDEFKQQFDTMNEVIRI
jgi:5'-deoxynucleotidase YfbR-like HD superfamily hydrolase